MLARKPLAERTVAVNVQEYGTGALNIDGCRIENDIDEATITTRTSERNQNAYGNAEQSDIASASPEGRYPANVVFDEITAEQLDNKIGILDSGGYPNVRNTSGYNGGLKRGKVHNKRIKSNSGGPSRYYYTSKASRAERTLNGRIENTHPTVKPVDLMEWLVKLVTKENQVVLDPFCGTGTTCRAAKNLGRGFVGIEESEKWADVARARCGLAPEDPDRLTEDGQTTL